MSKKIFLLKRGSILEPEEPDDSGVPTWCPQYWHDKCLEECPLVERDLVAHPGGGLSPVEKNKCGEGYWEDDF